MMNFGYHPKPLEMFTFRSLTPKFLTRLKDSMQARRLKSQKAVKP
jgi:hypothetical protein